MKLVVGIERERLRSWRSMDQRIMGEKKILYEPTSTEAYYRQKNNNIVNACEIYISEKHLSIRKIILFYFLLTILFYWNRCYRRQQCWFLFRQYYTLVDVGSQPNFYLLNHILTQVKSCSQTFVFYPNH